MTSDFTWVDVPNDPLHPLGDGAQEPLQFQADKAVDRILVDVGLGNEECAYRDGAFRGQYAAQSSIDGSNNVVLFRQGGWPNPPKVIPKVTSSSGGPAGALLPNLYSPLGLWALDGAPTLATMGHDRSSNARHLQGAAKAALGSIAGKSAITESQLYIPTDATIAALTGAMTFVCVLGVVANLDPAGWQVMFGLGNGQPTENDLCFFALDDDGLLEYYAQHASEVDITWTSTIAPPKNLRAVLSLRRHASGSVTVGIDDTYESSGALPVPTLRGGALQAQIGWGAPVARAPCRGGLDNAGLWGRDLTDSEMIPIIAAAKGL